jgi:error-prone DNA polymerase
VAGLVRAHAEAKKLGLKLLAGSEFVLDGGDGRFRLIALAHNLQRLGRLCEFITAGRRAAPKGEYRLGWQDVTADRLPDCELILAPDRLTRSAITLEALCDRATLGRRQFGSAHGVPLVAAGDVLMHVRSRKVLHDVLTAVRLGTPVAQCGFGLQPNAEAHLRSRLRLAALYPPELLAHTLVVAARCSFSLDELRYQYPRKPCCPAHARPDPAPPRRRGRPRALPAGRAASVQRRSSTSWR